MDDLKQSKTLAELFQELERRQITCAECKRKRQEAAEQKQKIINKNNRLT